MLAFGSVQLDVSLRERHKMRPSLLIRLGKHGTVYAGVKVRSPCASTAIRCLSYGRLKICVLEVQAALTVITSH
jgi:hypothetical protein